MLCSYLVLCSGIPVSGFADDKNDKELFTGGVYRKCLFVVINYTKTADIEPISAKRTGGIMALNTAGAMGAARDAVEQAALCFVRLYGLLRETI
jgi:hypothetical protein